MMRPSWNLTSGLTVLALSGALAVGACNRTDKSRPAPPPAPAPAAGIVGFSHEAGFDGQGYYRPTGSIAVNGMKLVRIAVGSPSDFESWEAGRRDEAFGPIVMQFLPLGPDGRTAENEDELVGVRVGPLAYGLTPGRLSFRGFDRKLGDISFEGAFDTPALASARTTGNSDAQPVLKGVLKIGGSTVKDAAFTYWAGD